MTDSEYFKKAAKSPYVPHRECYNGEICIRGICKINYRARQIIKKKEDEWREYLYKNIPDELADQMLKEISEIRVFPTASSIAGSIIGVLAYNI